MVNGKNGTYFIGEDFQDKEWEMAENSGEEKQYYWQTMYSGGKTVKFYTPSLAKLVMQRTGLKLTPVVQGHV